MLLETGYENSEISLSTRNHKRKNLNTLRSKREYSPYYVIICLEGKEYNEKTCVFDLRKKCFM